MPLELLASPLKGGRPLSDADRSALVIGGTEKIRTRDGVVFCKVVAVAEAQVKRDGQVRAKGSPVHHATLGPLEERLESQAGPGVTGGIAGNARLERRFVKGGRERLLAAAFMIRVIVLMTLMPEARVGDVIAMLAGDLVLVPWARPWRPASARAAGDWRNALGAVPLEELRDTVLGASWREHQGAGCPGAVTVGRNRPLKAGSLDGSLLRVPDTPGNRAFFGSVGTGDDSSPFPQVRALPLTCCSCRSLFAMPSGPAGTEKAAAEQSLLDEAMDRFPALFAPDWIWLMDRNYHGAARIARMIRSAHVLIRLKRHPAEADLGDPARRVVPGGTVRRRRHRRGPGYRVLRLRGGAGGPGDVLPGHRPDGLRGVPGGRAGRALKWRWDGSETALREAKAPLRGAGPARGRCSAPAPRTWRRRKSQPGPLPSSWPAASPAMPPSPPCPPGKDAAPGSRSGPGTCPAPAPSGRSCPRSASGTTATRP